MGSCGIVLDSWGGGVEWGGVRVGVGEQVRFVAVFHLSDALSANALCSWHWALHAPRLLLIHSRCDLHQVHMATTSAITSLQLLSPMCSLYTQSMVDAPATQLMMAVLELLRTDQVDVI